MVYTVFGLFLLPISAEFHWPRSAVSIVLLIVAVAGAIGYPIVGRAIDRYGARVVVLSGIVAFAVAVSLVALINANGLALGIVGGLGNGIGSAVSPLYAQALITWHGWRAAYVGLAAAILCIGLPVLSLLLRDPPSATRESARLAGSAGDATLAEARAGRTFWIILLA